MASEGYVDTGKPDTSDVSTVRQLSDAAKFDPKLGEVEEAEAEAEKAKALTRESLDKQQEFLRDLQKKHPNINIKGLKSTKPKDDTAPEEPPVVSQQSVGLPSEGYVDEGKPDTPDVSAVRKALPPLPTSPAAPTLADQVRKLTPQPQQIEKKDALPPEGYVDTGKPDTSDVSAVRTGQPSDQKPERYDEPRPAPKPSDPNILKFFNWDEIAPWLQKQKPKTINTLYDKLKETSVPTGVPVSEQTFYERQNVDDMPVPLTGSEPYWEEILQATTQEGRQQLQLEKKKDFIERKALQIYKRNLSPEEYEKFVTEQGKKPREIPSWKQKLINWEIDVIEDELEDITNPKSDLRLGKEAWGVDVGEPTTGEFTTVDKPLSQKEAVLYMLKVDGLDEDDALWQYHEMTDGRDYIGWQKAKALGLRMGAYGEAGIEYVLKWAYDNGVAQRINKFIGPGRELFTGSIKKDMGNLGEALWFAGLEFPEMMGAMTPWSFVHRVGMAISAGFKGTFGSLKGPAKKLSRRIPAGQRGAIVNNAIDKGEFKDRHYRQWLRWKEGGPGGPGAARVQTYFGRLDKIEDAKKVARANSEIQQELLAGTRDRIKNEFDIDIVDEIKGRLVINQERLREAGNLSTRKAFDASDRTLGQKITGSAGDVVKADELAAIRTGASEIADPMLNPEMFEQMIAVTADLRKAFPDALKTTGDKRLIDRLFDLTVNKDLLGENAPQLQKILDKYNISFENYSLAIVGSGSKAGKVLNKLSQLKRLRTGDEIAEEGRKASEEAQGAIRRWVMRIENIRRGLLVSQFATAARNLSSAGIRMPLEALGNVMDTVLLAGSKGGVKAGAKALWSGENWKGSFRGLSYMFSNPRTAKEYTDLILTHPQLDGQFKQLFNNLNEIQRLTGRGSGGMADKLTGVVEDAVSILNIPNRMQEYLVRRSMFMGEMERLVKREWGVNLLDEVGAGKLDELMSKVDMPEGSMSFAQMAQVATKRALDVTYAKQPDVAAFKTLSTFITRNGLTVAMPFPRFMFNGMELVGQYAGGASVPLTKYVHHLISKTAKRPFKKPLTHAEIVAGKTAYTEDAFKLTAKDRERISRNILGVGAIAAAYAYRTDESAPSDYKKLNADDGHTIDTSPQFPLRQMLFLGEVVKQLIDPLKGPNDKRSLIERADPENLASWFAGDKGNIAKEFMQTFVGSNIRSGVGEGIVSEIMDLYKGVTGSQTGLIDSERSAKAFGRVLGNYMASWAVPLAQIVDVQRALGYRPTEKKDAARQPVLGDPSETFMDNLTRPFRSRVGESFNDLFEPSKADRELIRRQDIATGDPERKRPAAKVLTGLNFGPEDGPEVQYLQKVFNYAPWKIGSKDQRPHIRRYENESMRSALPLIVRQVKKAEQDSRNQWNARSDKFKSEVTERMFVKQRGKMFVEAELKKAREKISSMRLDAMQKGEGKNKAIEWQLYTEKFRKLPPAVRDFAWTEWTKKHPEQKLDYMNPRHMVQLFTYGDEYWKAYSKSSSGKKNGLGVKP